MIWLLLCAIVAATIALALIAWRKWIAPWQQVEELVTEIGRGEQPRTFLSHGGAEPQRIGLRLEKIFNALKQLNKQIAKRESGMQTIFSAMQDARGFRNEAVIKSRTHGRYGHDDCSAGAEVKSTPAT